MTRIIKHKYILLVILIALLTVLTATGCSQPKIQVEELNRGMTESEKKIKALESEIDILTEQKSNLMLELYLIGVPDKIKYLKGYQGKVKIMEDTTFKLMPTGNSEILATLEAGTVVEALAVGEVTTYDPC
jgi:hypothetical protein